MDGTFCDFVRRSSVFICLNNHVFFDGSENGKLYFRRLSIC